MNCLCEQKETYVLKIVGDAGADPVWCQQCGCNVDLENVPI